MGKKCVRPFFCPCYRGDTMNYFFGLLGFALGLAGCSGIFLGRPTLGTTRISSIAERGYIPVGPQYSTGLIPFACNCRFTVSGNLFNSLAMIEIGIKSFPIYCHYRLICKKSQQCFLKWDNILYRFIGFLKKNEKLSQIRKILLDLLFRMWDNKSIERTAVKGWKTSWLVLATGCPKATSSAAGHFY